MFEPLAPADRKEHAASNFCSVHEKAMAKATDPCMTETAMLVQFAKSTVPQQHLVKGVEKHCDFVVRAQQVGEAQHCIAEAAMMLALLQSEAPYESALLEAEKFCLG